MSVAYVLGEDNSVYVFVTQTVHLERTTTFMPNSTNFVSIVKLEANRVSNTVCPGLEMFVARLGFLRPGSQIATTAVSER